MNYSPQTHQALDSRVAKWRPLNFSTKSRPLVSAVTIRLIISKSYLDNHSVVNSLNAQRWNKGPVVTTRGPHNYLWLNRTSGGRTVVNWLAMSAKVTAPLVLENAPIVALMASGAGRWSFCPSIGTNNRSQRRLHRDTAYICWHPVPIPTVSFTIRLW